MIEGIAGISTASIFGMTLNVVSLVSAYVLLPPKRIEHNHSACAQWGRRPGFLLSVRYR